MAFNTNDLFDAVSTIATSIVKKLEYDQTIEAKIVSTTQKGEGIYKVEYQSAIFNAYANDSSSYYENETVYVMVPKGDFTKQKYIIGRKVEKNGEDTGYDFNFKLPFDNFIALENLTADGTIDQRGFLANHPMHGRQNDLLVDSLLSTLSEAELALQEQITAKNRSLTILDHNYRTVTLQSLQEHASDNTGTLLNAYQYDDTHTFLQALVEAVERVCKDSTTLQNIGIYNTYWQWYLQQTALECAIPKKDLVELQTAAYGAYSKARILIEADIVALQDQFNASIEDRFNELVRSVNNENLIWSWSRPTTDGEYAPVFESKLGIGIDFQTLLGSYRPISGDYGLRILITGTTKPTEEMSSTTITEELYLRKEDMYGNVYAFYEPYVQQKIFDVSGFLCVQRIDIFFWQDHDFIDYTGAEIPYLDTATDEDGNAIELPPNILLTDLVVQFGLTADECKTDHTFLYTYDDMYYGYDPYNDQELYQDYLYEKNLIEENTEMTDAQQADAIQELTDAYIAKGALWLKKTRKLQMAWVHIDPEDGPILINHIDYEPADNYNDKQSLRYWQKKYDVKIQWYHYEYACEQDTTTLAERQGGINWKYLKSWNVDPLPVEELDQWRTKVDSLFEITVAPDELKAKDKWKVIVSLNGTPRESEPLIFTNRDITIESGTFESLNEVVFKILREKRETLSIGESHYSIVEDDTLRDFYVYDINNQCIKNDDNVFYSDLNYYIQVWIRNNDTGEYSPMTYDPDLGLDEVIWHWPESNSMIASYRDCTDDELANAVLAPTIDYASTAYNDQIKNVTRSFKIKREWHAAQTNNTISATIKRKNRSYHATLMLNFGPSSSCGSDYVLTVSQRLPAGSMIVKDQPFEIKAIVRDKTGNAEENSKYVFTWELLSPTIVTKGAHDSDLTPKWELKNSDGFLNNVLAGYVRNDNPPVFKVTVTGAADYPISQVTGFRLCNHASVADTYVVSACAERVEFKADGTVPITYYGTFEVSRLQDEERIDIWPTWEFTQWRKNPGTAWPADVINNSTGALALPDYFDIKTAAEPNKLINSNRHVSMWCIDATDDKILNGPYSLTSSDDYKYATNLSDIQNAIERAYSKTVEDARTAHADEEDPTELDELIQAAEDLKTERLTTLYGAANLLVPGYVVYALNPYIKNENVTADVGWYWQDGMDVNYYSVLSFTIPDRVFDGQPGWFKQAVPFTRNLYSSSLLNSWDGHLFLDEENNAVLAQMVSAGTKDKDNRFTGVIMGNWAGVSDSSLDIPGLYGMKDGGQVFGFKTDGTGFIGKSGRGRILFDGNQSLISNIDKTCYINLDPIRYVDTDDSTSVIGNYRGYSPYFLYSETKKTSTASLDGEQKLEESTQWASRYFNDSARDYFIVDPNNGILTTGGIVSRYGKIGNWMISAAGLYQKAERENALASRYMYLGFNGLTSQALQDIADRYAAAYKALEDRRQMAIDSARAKYILDEFETIGEYTPQIYDVDPLHYWNYGWPFEPFSYALSDTLTEINEYTPSSNIKLRLQENLKRQIEADNRTGYHFHYSNGIQQPVNPEIYTGAANVLRYLVAPIWIEEPDWLTEETLAAWAEHGRFTGDAHYTVYWEDPTPVNPDNPDNPDDGTHDNDNPDDGNNDDNTPTDSGIRYRYKWKYNDTYFGTNDGYLNVSSAQHAAIYNIMDVFTAAEEPYEDHTSAQYTAIHEMYLEALSNWVEVMDDLNNGTDNTVESYIMVAEETGETEIDDEGNEVPVTQQVEQFAEPEEDTTVWGEYYILPLTNIEDESNLGQILASVPKRIWLHQDAHNVSDDYYQTVYWFMTVDLDNEVAYLYRIYNTLMNQVLIRESPTGYSNYNSALAAQRLIPEDEHAATIVYEDTLSRWYLIENGEILIPPAPSEEEGSGGGGGGGSGAGGGGGGGSGDDDNNGPLGPTIPMYTNTYYSLRPETYPGRAWSDDDYRAALGAVDISIPTFHWENEETYTIARIYEVLKQANAIHKYFFLAYTDQLNTMIEAGLADLTDEQFRAYQLKKRENELLLAAEIVKINEEYAALKLKLDAMVEAAKDEEIVASDDRYAIYTGYISPETPNKEALLAPYEDDPAMQTRIKMPLFSVSWRGAVTMREALIGYESPWLVTDYGLTQSNNFGTIFLGNPGRPDKMQTWSTLGGGLLEYQEGKILTGGIENNRLLIHPDDHKVPDASVASIMYSMFNTLPTSKDEIDADRKDTGLTRADYLKAYKAKIPLVYGEYGNFAIQAGNLPSYSNTGEITNWDRKIHFGVRMDGTIFSDRGKIGGWRITDTELASYKNDQPCHINDSGEMILTDEGRKEFIATLSFPDDLDINDDEAREAYIAEKVNALSLKEYIALDTAKNEIRLSNSQIVLDGNDGVVYIGKRSKDKTIGTMYLASHKFAGESNERLTYQESSPNPDPTAVQVSNGGAINWNQIAEVLDGDPIDISGSGGYYITGKTWYVHDLVQPEGVEPQKLGGNKLSIGEDIGGTYCGMRLSNMQTVTEEQVTNENGETVTQETLSGDGVAYLYPLGVKHSGTATGIKVQGWLGTPANRWNLYGNTIYCPDSSIWMGGYLVATESYVSNLISWCHANIVAVDEAAHAAINKAHSSLSALWALVNANFGGHLTGSEQAWEYDPETGQWTQTGNTMTSSLEIDVSGSLSNDGENTVSGTVNVGINQGPLQGCAIVNKVEGSASQESLTITVNGIEGEISGWAEALKATFKAGWEAACAAAEEAKIRIIYSGATNNDSGSVDITAQLVIPGNAGSGAEGKTITRTASKAYTYTASAYTKETHSYTASSHSDGTGTLPEGHSYTASSHSYSASSYTASSLVWSSAGYTD